MSKAFTRESDDSSDMPPVARQLSSLPVGAKNYMTLEGIRRLHEELDRLLNVERPRLAASMNDDEAKRQRQLLDARILQLQQSLRYFGVIRRCQIGNQLIFTLVLRGDGRSQRDQRQH